MNALALSISGITINQDANNRYCLNDLHQASGGDQKHRPKYFLESNQIQELIFEIDNEGGNPPSKIGCDIENSTNKKAIEIIRGRGKKQGTYAVKEIVYAYAMWISAKFHLQVIRAYDALVTQNLPLLEPPTITKAQQGDIYNKVKLIAGNNHKAIPALWSRFHHQFNINSYKELPASKYNAAIEYIDFLNQQYNDGVEMLFISSVELEKLVKERIALLPSPELTRESVLAMIDEKLKLIPESLPEIEIPTKTYNQDARQCIDLLRKTKLTYQQQELVDHLERCTISAWTHFDEMVPRLRMCADLAMRWRGTPYSIAA